ncbi:hypothetical protein M5689_001811 [Euphorbia peplus]|nr:hypothetical protein M5689_001811 [Euphorbia peplus]
MHEFILCNRSSDFASVDNNNNNKKENQLDKCVLCKVYNKNYNVEARNNNENDTTTACDSNTNQTIDTNNDVDVEATTADDLNVSQAANANNEDVAAETGAGDLNTIINQTTDIINFRDEHISNQAQLVHNPTNHQWHPQPQPQPQLAPRLGINQDLYDIYGQSCSTFGANEQQPDGHLYPMDSNFSQYSLFDQTRYNMMIGSSSSQAIPYSVELFSNQELMNRGDLDVQPLSLAPYDSPKRTRFGL